MSTRKDFLAATAALAAAPAAVSAAPAPKASPARSSSEKLHFDPAAFAAALDRDVPHKHLFGAKYISGGDVFTNVRATLNAYTASGTPLSNVAPVVVLYHEAMLLGLDDAMWNRYVLPATAKAPKEAPADLLKLVSPKTRGNPFMEKKSGEWDSSIPTLTALADTRFFICNNALTGFAHALAKRMKLDPATVRNEWAAHLIPNSMLVPAGVWAVHAIQEHKYTLLQSS